MHLKRWITSIMAVPVLALIYFGSLPVFAGFIGVIALVAMWEYFYIVFGGRHRLIYTAIPLWGALVGVLLVVSATFGRIDIMLLLVWINLMVSAVLSMPKFKNNGGDILNVVAREIQFVAYIPLSLATLVLLRAQPDGVTWIFFLLFVVFLGDVGAYYVGTYFGRHKLIAAISPGKTIEGALGGLAVNLAVGAGFAYLLLPETDIRLILGFVVLVGIMAQLGDLFESELKRAADIKDSGAILPGHGGILDRIDALLFAAPVAYIFKVFLF
ncbi:MAG: phosphatidate cytidylyltransferase [Thermodesulfobacteriota bacterium]